jgi:hypothetical protein
MLDRVGGHLPTIQHALGYIGRAGRLTDKKNMLVYHRIAFVDPERTITQPSSRYASLFFATAPPDRSDRDAPWVGNIGINVSELSRLRRFLAGN